MKKYSIADWMAKKSVNGTNCNGFDFFFTRYFVVSVFSTFAIDWNFMFPPPLLSLFLLILPPLFSAPTSSVFALQGFLFSLQDYKTDTVELQTVKTITDDHFLIWQFVELVDLVLDSQQYLWNQEPICLLCFPIFWANTDPGIEVSLVSIDLITLSSVLFGLPKNVKN